MKKYIALWMMATAFSACLDEKVYEPKLPDAPEQEVKSYALPTNAQKTFVHPGGTVASEDLERAKRNMLSQEPWKSAFDSLKTAPYFNDTEFPRTADLMEYNGKHYILRGPVTSFYIEEFDRTAQWGESNYRFQQQDCSVAWSNAIYWHLTGDTEAADKVVTILNAWAKDCQGIVGTTSASYSVMESGFAFANIAELMREYTGWEKADQDIFKKWLIDIHVNKLVNFLDNHHNSYHSYYNADWDLGHMAALMAIGIYCDRADLYNKVIDYVTYGKGNGNFRNFINYLHAPKNGEDDVALGQVQPAYQSQSTSLTSIQYASAICRMAWNQGDDLYGYDDNRFLKGAEMTAKYNYGPEIEEDQGIELSYPFTSHFANAEGAYANTWGESGRGNVVYGFVSIYEHYRKHKNIDARYIRWAAKTPTIRVKYEPEKGEEEPEEDIYILKHFPQEGKTLIERETFNGSNGAGLGHGTLLFTEE